jgi:hypothetical protein
MQCRTLSTHLSHALQPEVVANPRAVPARGATAHTPTNTPTLPQSAPPFLTKFPERWWSMDYRYCLSRWVHKRWFWYRRPSRTHRQEIELVDFPSRYLH